MKLAKQISKNMRHIPNFPKEGIDFCDITTLLNNAKLFNKVVKYLKNRYKNYNLDYIVGIESRGFIFASALAYALGIGFVPIRKQGKLPATTFSKEYNLEYGSSIIEIHKDAFKNTTNAKVLLIDDLVATAGSAMAAIDLLEQTGAKIKEVCFVIELQKLGGIQKLNKYPTYSILKI